LRNLGALVLAIPILVAVYARSLLRRGIAGRLGAGIAAAAIIGLVAVVSLPPAQSAASPVSEKPAPVAAELLDAVRTGHSLTAPFAGSVRERHATPGQYLATGAPVVTIVKVHPLRLRVSIPERESSSVRVGQLVRVTLEGDPTVHQGRVSRISPAIEEDSRTLNIEAEVANPAGLLRPEAWLLSAAYLAWLAPGRERGELLRLAALAASAPALWALSDLLVTGDPLHSLTGTRDTAETLRRRTGLGQVPGTVPRRLGEILREPVLVGAAGGGILALAWLRDRARLPAIVGVASMVAFCVLAAAGLPILGRYLLLPAALLAIFAGAGAFGWLALAREDPRRRAWAAFGALVLVLLAAFAPAQADRLASLRRSIGIQERIRDDLHALADSGAFRAACAPVAVPNHRPVPLLALWLDRRSSGIVSAQLRRPRRGYYVDPATAAVERNFTLDRNDPRPLTAAVPPGFALVARNRSWRLFARC